MPKLNADPAETGLQLTTRVEREIATVAQKIRINEIAMGGAVLVVAALSYALVAILLDKWLMLPSWVRQFGFVGFLTLAGGIVYASIVRPLTRTVNPRYIARQVEATLPESKNELINWVDLQQRELPGSVKSALADRAAAGFGDADVDSAVRSRKLYWIAGVAGALVVALAVLFLVYKGSQFGSLLSRAFNPFQSNTVIATRTTIEVLEPVEPDATVADGDQLHFLIRLGGRVPDAHAADKARLKLRYGDEQTEEIAFAKTDTLREFELILTRGTIQNGFWYTVAAGDAETAEHKIIVRTKPLIKGFETFYEYPAYLRIAPSSNTDPRWRGYPGTKVRMEVKTNRKLKAGSLMIEPRAEAVEASLTGEKNDTLRFAKTLDKPGQYRVAFASAAGESSGLSPAYPIEILPDHPPAIAFAIPATDEITLAIDAPLELEAVVTDDFGIENTVLKYQLVNGPKLASKPYLNATSFKRDTDGTFPTRLEYKESVRLNKLTDEKGQPVALAVGQALEVWLEAKDNCTVLPHEVGKSKRIKINLIAPPPLPKPDEAKKRDDQAAERERKAQEHQVQEKNKQANESREAPRNPNPQAQPPEPKPGEGEKKPGESQPGQNPMNNDPNAKPPEGMPPPDQDVEKKAEELKEKIDEKNREAGEAKANPNGEKPKSNEPLKSGERKPGEASPKDNDAADSKPGDPGEMKNPMDQKADSASQNKGAGQVPPNEEAKEKAKPEGKSGEPSAEKNQPSNDKPQASKPDEKPGNEKPNALPMEQPKPGEKPSDNQPAGGKTNDGKKDDGKPQPGQAKPNGESKPGTQKESPKSGEAGTESPRTEDREQRPGEAKSDKPTDTANKKPNTGNGTPPPDAGMAKPSGDPMKPDESAGNEKLLGADPKAQLGEEKSAAKPGKPKPSAEDKKKIEEAVKNLDSTDPAKKKEARETLDKTVGPENRQKAEQLQKDLKSNDATQREKAEKELDAMAKQAGDKGDQAKPTKEEIEQLGKDAKDLNNPDTGKKQAAEQKLDEKIGKGNREKLQKEMKDRDAANEKKLGGAAKDQNEKANPGAKAPEPTKEQIEQLAKDAKDLNSADEDKKKTAEQKLDDKIGKENREKLQKEMKDREAADQKKLADAAQDQANKPKPPTKEQIEELAKDAKDLNNPDADKRKAAEKKLDNKIGKANREKLQQDLNNRDAKAAADERNKLEDAAKRAAKEKAEKTPGTPPKEPTQEEIDKLKQAADDLNSTDPAKKQAAEQKLDQEVGKPAREQLQKNLKDLKADDPKKSREARDRLEEMAKQWQPGNGGQGQDGKAIADNPENRLKAAELQLDDFKKYRGDKNFLKDNNMSEAEYEKFLRGYNEMVDRQRKELADDKLNPPQARPTGPSTSGANDGYAGRVNAWLKSGQTPPTAGPSFAPPGFSDAQRDFAKEARDTLEQSKKTKK